MGITKSEIGITKYVLPVIIGAMTGMILITVGECGMHLLYPMPPGTDLYDVDSLAKYVAKLPATAFMIEVGNYIVCSFFAGLVASLISKRTSFKPALVVGIILTLAGLYNVINIPQPVWFSIVSMLTYLPFAYLGYLLVRKKTVVDNVSSDDKIS